MKMSQSKYNEIKRQNEIDAKYMFGWIRNSDMYKPGDFVRRVDEETGTLYTVVGIVLESSPYHGVTVRWGNGFRGTFKPMELLCVRRNEVEMTLKLKEAE